MSNKGNNIIGILVLLIGICMIIAIIVSANRTPKNEIFDDKKVAEGTELYNSIMGLSDDNYPQTPEEVVQLYGKGYTLLYGNMLKDNSHITEILTKQRILLSGEVLDTNMIEFQQAKLETDLKDFKDKGFFIMNFETLPAIYGITDNTKARVRVKMVGNTMADSDFYWNYYLQREKETEKWKIIGWKAADENYNDINNENNDNEKDSTETTSSSN